MSHFARVVPGLYRKLWLELDRDRTETYTSQTANVKIIVTVFNAFAAALHWRLPVTAKAMALERS